MLASACALAIACGVIAILDHDLTWQLYEYDRRVANKIVQRTEDWWHISTATGVFLIILGVSGLLTVIT